MPRREPPTTLQRGFLLTRALHDSPATRHTFSPPYTHNVPFYRQRCLAPFETYRSLGKKHVQISKSDFFRLASLQEFALGPDSLDT